MIGVRFAHGSQGHKVPLCGNPKSLIIQSYGKTKENRMNFCCCVKKTICRGSKQASDWRRKIISVTLGLLLFLLLPMSCLLFERSCFTVSVTFCSNHMTLGKYENILVLSLEIKIQPRLLIEFTFSIYKMSKLIERNYLSGYLRIKQK